MRSDPSTSHPPSLPIQAAVAVVVVKHGKVLALQRANAADFAPAVWEVVAGRVEVGESLLDAAARELEEETGLVVGRAVTIDSGPIDAYIFPRGEVSTVLVVYRADASHDRVRLSDAHQASGWWTAEEFRAAGTPARLVEAIERAF